jgi:Protein of unknown function (DUF1264)
MNFKLLFASGSMLLSIGCATTTTPVTPAAETEHNHASATNTAEPKYNPVMNPRQTEHPNVMGFNDLHIQALRHLKPDVFSADDPKLHAIVHHHCKAYDDGTLVCLMFPNGMKDQDKPIGFEYIITTAQFNTLPEKEKHYWHYHKTEVGRACATFPDLTKEETDKILPAIHETYGKVVYFQKPEDKYPLGEPYVLIVQDMPEVKN